MAAPSRPPQRTPTLRQVWGAFRSAFGQDEDAYYEDEPVFRSILLAFLVRLYAERLTPAGRWFMGATVAFALYGMSSLDIQTYLLFCYSAALCVVATFAARWFRPRATLRVRNAERVCAGETLPVEVILTGAGDPPGIELAVVPHRPPASIHPVPPSGALVRAPATGEVATARLGLRCARRGIFRLAGFRVETSFPFGLIHARTGWPEERSLVVYPRFTRLTRLEVGLSRRYQPGGVAMASVVGDAFEYLGNREYRYGDNLRDIDWRATARLNAPIVREYREEYFLRVAVVLDTHVPPEAGTPAREAFEQAVSLAAAVSDYMARQDYLVDLFAAGPNLYHLTAGRSLAYLDQILDILAAVRASRNEPFDVLEPELLDHLSRITTVVCVFLDWNEARREFARNLQVQGTSVKVIVVRNTACTLDPAVENFSAGPVSVVTPRQVVAGLEEL